MESDYLNPHIRPWPSRRTIDDQIEDLRKSRSVCLYPTPEALKDVTLPEKVVGKPYDEAMARGRGTLEMAFFQFDVLEQYRNDARYKFRYWDFGVNFGVSDDVYLDTEEPERDKIGLWHVGFAYDLRGFDASDESSPLVRRVAVFYGDLTRLTPEHQQRWKTYEVPEAGLDPHPVWWGQQMGNWPDGLGPFGTLFAELQNLNELWQSAFDTNLFATTDRPDDFGWILRPSQREWDEFIHNLDKVLSENIKSAALDAVGAPRTGDDGQRIGTLVRLSKFMIAHGVTQSAATVILKPIREVRKARQKPAHSLWTNITDKTFVHRQVALMGEINQSLTGLAFWLKSHPSNKEWRPSEVYEHYYFF